MPLHVHGLGTAVPPYAISPDEAAEGAALRGCSSPEQQRQLRALYRLSRVKKRHSVLLESDTGAIEARQSFFPPMRGADDRGPGTAARMAKYEREAPALGARAARLALEQAGRAPGDVTHLVTVSCTGFAAPSFDLGIVREVGLPWTIARTNVGFMGCHGALNGLRVASGYADGDPGACILVCAVELCSLHYQYGWSSDLAVSNGIFADGAAALVGGAAPASSGDDWVLARSGASLLEDSAELMAWRIGDHGFEMALSARVPAVIEHALRPWLDAWLASQQLAWGDIATWAIHPGGPRILESVAAATGIGREAYAISQEVLGEFGNMSSPTILFILDRLRQRGAPRPCLALGFGPGLAVEAALFR